MLAIDLVTKRVFFDLRANETTKTTWIALTRHHNAGLLFDLPFPRALLIGITLAIVVIVLLGLGRAIRANHRRQTLALALILGGALGNLFDRYTLGFVRDWLLFFGTSALNLADIAIGLGLLLYLYPQS